MPNKNYSIELSLADQVRLNKVMNETGYDAERIIMSLIHDFFCHKGVKNPPKKDL